MAEPKNVIHDTTNSLRLRTQLDAESRKLAKAKRNATLLLLLLVVVVAFLAWNYWHSTQGVLGATRATPLVFNKGLMIDGTLLYVLMWLAFVGQRFFFFLLFLALAGGVFFLSYKQHSFPPKPGVVMSLYAAFGPHGLQGDDAAQAPQVPGRQKPLTNDDLLLPYQNNQPAAR